MAKKKNPIEEDAESNMTPMIDVTFQLLIFFIVTMKFRTLEKKLDSHLPTDFGTNTSTELVDELFITVKLKQPEGGGPIRERETRYYVETERIDGTTDADIYAKIQRKIAKFRSSNKDAKGKIEAGLGVPHHRVVSVLDLFHKTNYETITFVGLAANKSLVDGQKWWNKVRSRLDGTAAGN